MPGKFYRVKTPDEMTPVERYKQLNEATSRMRGGEFQVYADKSDFIRVAIEASKNDVVLVYGEDRRGTGRVLASQVVCREGGASP